MLYYWYEKSAVEVDFDRTVSWINPPHSIHIECHLTLTFEFAEFVCLVL